jgi:hypothetical protein
MILEFEIGLPVPGTVAVPGRGVAVNRHHAPGRRGDAPSKRAFSVQRLRSMCLTCTEAFWLSGGNPAPRDR